MARIYSLDHPITKHPFYVGVTRGSLYTRLNGHLNNKRSDNHLRTYLNKLWEDGLIPKISEIEVVDSSESKFTESFWIRQFKAWGFNILNKNYLTPTKYKRSYGKPGRPKKEIYTNKKALFKIRAGNKWNGIVFGYSNFPGTIDIRTTDLTYDVTVCEICKVEFIIKPKSKQRFCGYTCSGISRRNKRVPLERRRAIALKKMKKIIAIDGSSNEIKFDSIQEASIALLCSQSAISNVLAGREKQTKGFKFKFQ